MELTSLKQQEARAPEKEKKIEEKKLYKSKVVRLNDIMLRDLEEFKNKYMNNCNELLKPAFETFTEVDWIMIAIAKALHETKGDPD